MMASEILSGSVELPQGSAAYHRLRNLERSYLALQAIYPARAISERLLRLKKWIENPRAYAFLAGKSESDLIMHMKSAGVGIGYLAHSFLKRPAV
jgi:hypothetical protein